MVGVPGSRNVTGGSGGSYDGGSSYLSGEDDRSDGEYSAYTRSTQNSARR